MERMSSGAFLMSAIGVTPTMPVPGSFMNIVDLNVLVKRISHLNRERNQCH